MRAVVFSGPAQPIEITEAGQRIGGLEAGRALRTLLIP